MGSIDDAKPQGTGALIYELRHARVLQSPEGFCFIDYPDCLSPSFRRDQHVVGGRLDGDGDAEQGFEGGMGRSAPVEAEDELVKVGLEMRSAQTVVDTKPPGLEVGED